MLDAGLPAAQIRQLLFPGVPNRKPDAGNLEMERAFKVGTPPGNTAALPFRGDARQTHSCFLHGGCQIP